MFKIGSDSLQCDVSGMTKDFTPSGKSGPEDIDEEVALSLASPLSFSTHLRVIHSHISIKRAICRRIICFLVIVYTNTAALADVRLINGSSQGVGDQRKSRNSWRV